MSNVLSVTDTDRRIGPSIHCFTTIQKNAAARFPSRNVWRRCTIWDGRFTQHSCLRQTDAFQLPLQPRRRGAVDSTMQTFRSGMVSVRSIRYMECPQSSSSDGKDAGRSRFLNLPSPWEYLIRRGRFDVRLEGGRCSVKKLPVEPVGAAIRPKEIMGILPPALPA